MGLVSCSSIEFLGSVLKILSKLLRYFPDKTEKVLDFALGINYFIPGVFSEFISLLSDTLPTMINRPNCFLKSRDAVELLQKLVDFLMQSARITEFDSEIEVGESSMVFELRHFDIKAPFSSNTTKINGIGYIDAEEALTEQNSILEGISGSFDKVELFKFLEVTKSLIQLSSKDPVSLPFAGKLYELQTSSKVRKEFRYVIACLFSQYLEFSAESIPSNDLMSFHLKLIKQMSKIPIFMLEEFNSCLKTINFFCSVKLFNEAAKLTAELIDPMINLCFIEQKMNIFNSSYQELREGLDNWRRLLSHFDQLRKKLKMGKLSQKARVLSQFQVMSDGRLRRIFKLPKKDLPKKDRRSFIENLDD